MKKPSEFAYPDKLPDDLKVLLQEQKVPADDPLIALLAWHWLRINESRDVLREHMSQLTTVLDERQAAIQDHGLKIGALLAERLQQLDGWSQTLKLTFDHLENLNKVLSEKPLHISKQITAELAHPIAQAVTLVKQVSVDAAALLKDVDTSRERLAWSHGVTAFLGGFSTGTLLILWIFSHTFLRSAAP